MKPALTLCVLPMSALLMAAQDDEPTSLRPTGAWTLNEQFARCTIERRFGPADQSHRLTFERGPSPLSVMAHVRVPSGADTFRPDRLILQSGGVVQQTRDGWRDQSGGADAPHFTSYFESLNAVPDDASAARVDVLRGQRPLLRFDFGGIGAALAALRACQDRRYAAWGADASAMRRVHVDATPFGDSRHWATTDDLPEQFRNMRTRRLAATALELSAEGRVVRCTVIESSGEALLDYQSCRVLTARARYRPARDAAGQAVPTVVARNIVWQAAP